MNEPTPAIDVSAIIVNWNSKSFLRQCLISLSGRFEGRSVEVIVIDGGSFDGCAEMLAREFPWVIFIQSETNVGFAKANNLAVTHARGRCLLFLNPDTELHENVIGTLLRRLDSLPNAGAVGCKLLNSDGSLQTSCVQAFPTIWNQVLDSAFLRRYFPGWKIWGTSALFASGSQPSIVEVIVGACLLVKRETFDSVGGFSECYFMYAEDADFCLKLKRSGCHVYYVPETSLIHHGGSSSQQAGSSFSSVMMRRSIYQFIKCNEGCGSAFAYRTAIVGSSVLRLFLILLLFPVWRNRPLGNATGSLKKWYSILRWGLEWGTGGSTRSPEFQGSRR
jgi:GT2 family glycosyltransferase